MKQAYVSFRFSTETKQTLKFISDLIVSYQAQGFTLSVRQLYYQLVARDKVPNTERSYKRVASIINDGRLAGVLDWDAIEDRGRDIEVRNRWASGAAIVEAVAQQFHMDMWVQQPARVFIIVEKAALAGVLGRMSRKWDVPLLAARGYPSVSIVREMVLEHIAPTLQENQQAVILHLGDHDPSGIDMTRDLDDRMRLFVEGENLSFDGVKRIALTMDQINDKQPPPNPAKVTDSRFVGYQQQYGDESWELDALEPAYLEALVEQHVTEYVDDERWQARAAEIANVKAHLAQASAAFAKKGI